MRFNKYGVKKILSFLIGLIFILSALLKLKSIDSFEIYIFSFGFLKLNTAFLFARIIISMEIFLGILVILRFFYKKTVLISILMLSIFSIFIIYLILVNDERHCHCFGELIEMSHFTSLMKNLILAGLLAYVYKLQEFRIGHKATLTTLSFIISFSVPLIISPPDSFYFQNYKEKTSYSKELLNQFLDEKPELKTGRRLVCFYGTGCRYCKLSNQKISVIMNKTDNIDSIYGVFMGTDEKVEEFFTLTKTQRYTYSIITPHQFLQITKGTMPLILLIEDEVVKSEFNYRSINEKEITTFFNE